MAATSDRLEPIEMDSPATNNYINLLSTAWRHKPVIVLGLVLGVCLGVLFYYRQTPVYSSTAQLIVIKKGTPISSITDDGRFYNDYLTEHQLIIKSPMLIQLAVQDPRFAESKTLRSPREAAESIIGSLNVTREPGKDAATISNVLNLSFSSTDPADCPLALEAIIDTYKKWLNERFKNSNKELLEQLYKLGNAMKEDMETKQKEIKEFRENSGIDVYVTSEGGRSPEDTMVANLKQKRSEYQVRKASLTDRISDLKTAIEEGRGREEWLNQIDIESLRAANPANPDSGKARMESRLERILTLKLERKKLLSQVGPKHPDVVQIDHQIAAIEEFYSAKYDQDPKEQNTEELVKAFLGGLEKELRNVNRELDTIGKLLEKEEKQARETFKYLQKYKELEGELARMVQLYMPLQQMATQAGYQLAQDVGGFEAQVISPPAPGVQIAPNKSRILSTAAFLGLVGGFIFGYLIDFLDKSFRTPEEIRRRLGVTVMANIPVIVPDETPAEEPKDGQPVLDRRVCTFYQSKSFQAEAFRGLRTALYFSTQGAVHKVIQITSPQASDGKSTVVANLAVSIAQSGRKCVLIDADLRKPRLHKIFDVSSTVGLASIISQEAEIKDAIQATAVEGLSIIPCGPRPSNPAELLTSPVFKEFIDTIREQFDYVLIDTPPLLAVSDPSVVAPRVDGVLLAIRVSKNGRPNAERAKEILNTLGANVLGVVVNGAGPGANGYGYGYGSYNYGYAYNYNYKYDYTYNYDTYSHYYDDDDDKSSESSEQHEPETTEALESSSNDSEATSHERHHSSQAGTGFLSRFWKRGG